MKPKKIRCRVYLSDNCLWHSLAPWPHLQLLRLLPDKHMVRMIMEFVRNRSFTLTIGDSKPIRLQRLKNGVPQGSVLTPLLFNIYVYDLSSIISKNYAYADDLGTLYSSGDWKVSTKNSERRHDYTFCISLDLAAKAQPC